MDSRIFILKWSWISENQFHQKSLCNIYYFCEFLESFPRHFNFWTFLEFSVFSQIPGIYPYISLFSFSHFSLSFLRRELTNLSSSLNAVILSIPLHVAFNAYGQIQLKSNHPCLLSFSSYFPSGRSYNLRVQLLAQTRASFEWRRKPPFLRFLDFEWRACW